MRTEQQKITKAPIEVVFGDSKYLVRPLNILKAQEWRDKLAADLGPIADSFQSQNGLVSKGLADALKQFPRKVVELVRAYAPDLPAQVEDEATDEQFSAAFDQIMVVAFPYLASLIAVIRVIQPNSPQ